MIASSDDFLRNRLDHIIDLRHPLAVLVSRMPWQEIEASLAPRQAKAGKQGKLYRWHAPEVECISKANLFTHVAGRGFDRFHRFAAQMTRNLHRKPYQPRFHELGGGLNVNFSGTTNYLRPKNKRVKNNQILFLSLTSIALSLVAVHSGIAFAADISWPTFNYALPNATHLLEIKQSTEHSKKLDQFRNSGFETAQGAWVSFQPWYGKPGKDISITWMTQMRPNLGLIWGASTGERGPKYSVAPSLTFGAVYQAEITKNGFLSLRGTTIVGGSLKEKSCLADYGAIGGMQEVNCRMAASPLEPSETLKYLVRDKPDNQHKLSIQFTQRF
jgi:hypothetical protein